MFQVTIMEINDTHYSLFELYINGFEPKTYWSVNEGWVCALCGEWYDNRDNMLKHVWLTHTDWFKAVWLTLAQCKVLKEKRRNVSEMIGFFFRRNKNDFSELFMKSSAIFDELYQDLFEPVVTETIYGNVTWLVCKTCGKSYANKPGASRHVTICRKTHERKQKPKPRIYLKPWQDPQSLFCSPNLKEIIEKEPLSGDECREANVRADR